MTHDSHLGKLKQKVEKLDAIFSNDAVKHNLQHTLDRPLKKKTALIYLGSTAGAESNLILHKFSQKVRACTIMYSPSLSPYLPSFPFLLLPPDLPLSGN